MRKIFIWLERLTAQFTHKLIVVSYYDKQKGLGSRIANENKYLLIRYGIDYSEFSRTDQDIKKELGINPNDLVIGMISCLKPQKCPQDFIKLAFLVNKAYANIKFLLVGDGILRKRVQNLINSFGLHNNVILTGWRRDIPRILTTIDVFVLTSLWEGFPISALEALASSKPVVATNTGGIEEIVVEGKNGFLVQPGDIKSLSERLNVLLRNNDLRKAIAHNAKSSLNFSAENMIRNNQSLYETLLRQNN
jgi:glycosyltransferase involved in cell wall biosynthesis